MSHWSILKIRASNYHQAGAEITAIPMWLHTIVFLRGTVHTVSKMQTLLTIWSLFNIKCVIFCIQTHSAHRQWKNKVLPSQCRLYRPECARECSGPSAIGHYYYYYYYYYRATSRSPSRQSCTMFLCNQVKLGLLFRSQVEDRFRRSVVLMHISHTYSHTRRIKLFNMERNHIMRW